MGVLERDASLTQASSCDLHSNTLFHPLSNIHVTLCASNTTPVLSLSPTMSDTPHFQLNAQQHAAIAALAASAALHHQQNQQHQQHHQHQQQQQQAQYHHHEDEGDDEDEEEEPTNQGVRADGSHLHRDAGVDGVGNKVKDNRIIS